MTEGNSHITKRLKPTQIPQAHQGQCCPAADMSHNTAHNNGTPKSKPTATPLIWSLMNKRRVMRLKPKRCSSLKVRQRLKGSCTIDVIKNTLPTKSSCRNNSWSM